ncbi:MAG: hypothetical protein M1824_005032 [Vezdaea acicularis]|nr:MAG: hypothetical protein M1824_005032 [Vezdaea acicularis]
MADMDMDIDRPEASTIQKEPPKQPVKPKQAIKTHTSRQSQWGYIHLTRISTPPPKDALDLLTAKTNLTAALTQFLGLTGSGIPVDILKVEEQDLWIRVQREDMKAVVAAAGGWVGIRKEGEESWRVRGHNQWLSLLLDQDTPAKLFNG